MKTKLIEIFIIVAVFLPIFAESSVRICVFWNRECDSIIIAPITEPLTINMDTIQPGDTLIVQRNTNFFIGNSGVFAISDGNVWRMLSGKCFGNVGSAVFADILLDTWVLLALLGEFPQQYPIDALCAGAVVLRSFALSNRHHKYCDLCDRTHCAQLPEPQPIPQKYNEAVERTAGLVLLCDDKIIPATLTANCGGRTIPADDVWGDDTRWSVAVIDTFCEPYEWSYSVPSSLLNGIFPLPPQQWHIVYDTLGAISYVFVGERTSIFHLWCAIVDTLGWGTLKSPTFSIGFSNDSIHFDGVGFGHRVGLCQAGAKKLAEMGASFREILKYYFPKATLKRWHKR